MFLIIIVDQKIVCDVGHFARHEKFPYDASFNKASKLMILSILIYEALLLLRLLMVIHIIFTVAEDNNRYT